MEIPTADVVDAPEILALQNIRLYERLGYRIIRKARFEESRFSVVFMEKTREI